MRFLLLSLLLGGVLTAAELPVTRVVLYKNGVGYFERSGTARAGEAVRLDFRADQMNDVLKSLTIEDRSGAKISGLRYDSSEPLDRKLAEYPFQLLPNLPLSGFLNQLRGAQVELRLPGEALAGTIVGGRQIPGDAKQAERETLTLLLASGELRQIDLATVTTLKFPDPVIEQQLKGYLGAVAAARSKDRKSVFLDSTDARERQLLASYLIPAAVWKSSYRLLFGAQQTTLEGWAIVDNTTGEDWTKVKLSLVSGRPVSFVSRLYEPQYRQRPTAELPEERAEAPVLYAGAVAAESAAGEGRRQNVGVMAKSMAAPPPPPPAPQRSMMRQDMASSVAAAATGREAGELFQYDFAAPVTVPKSESAMLPFLQQALTTRKLLIFTSSRGSENPMASAEITNSTGKTLDGGPITVFDGATYAGEALMETLKAGDKRLIGYAVDLGTRVTTSFDSDSEQVREATFQRGVLTLKTAQRDTTVYAIRNVDAKAKTLIIEHPVKPGFQLTMAVKPVESTAAAHRFEVKLAPNAQEKFTVTEERVDDQTIEVTSMTPEQVLIYARNAKLKDAARQGLEQIAARKREIAAADSEAKRLETEFRDLSTDQQRLRDNIRSLTGVTGQQEQVARYAQQLAAQETRLASLRDQQAEQRKKRAALEVALNALLEKLVF